MLRHLPAAVFVIGLTVVGGLLAGGILGPVGLILGFWVGLIAADRITRAVEGAR